MKTTFRFFCLTSLALLAIAFTAKAEPATPQLPQPTKEHEWLKKFVGEWDTETEIVIAEGQPPLKAKGSESAKMLGGFWVVGQNQGDLMGTPFAGIMTFGYDPDKKQYVGTWVDSNTSTLWQYTGTVSEDGTKLTMDSEGMCPMEGKVCKFRDTVEFISPDKRVLTGTKLDEKTGEWVEKMTVTATRKNS